MSWQDYSSAPVPGTPVCAEAELGATKSTLVTTSRGAFPLLLVRTRAGIRAFVNACPHQFLPLDHRGPSVLSADGERLICSAHGATFDAGSGDGLAGPGTGCGLDPVPVELQDGIVRIGGRALAA
jgi:nitrite reductase/ring-hydroxylating ferredoxin subunit